MALVVLASRPGLRNRIEDTLIAGLAEPRHPWVRRNLIEALYIIGDDNIRYLYQNWVPSLAKAESRRLRHRRDSTPRSIAWEPSTSPCSSAATGSSARACSRAMSEFFERPVLGGRIGNDLEPMLFYGDMVAKVASALDRRSSRTPIRQSAGWRSRPWSRFAATSRRSWPVPSRGGSAIPTARSARGRPR